MVLIKTVRATNMNQCSVTLTVITSVVLSSNTVTSLAFVAANSFKIQSLLLPSYFLSFYG